MTNGIMTGKRGLIMGVANDKSLAWGIAHHLHKQGAELAFTYQGEILEKRVRPLAESTGSDFLIPCDVSDEELKGPYFDTSKKNFATALDISCYSFTSICRRALPLMSDGGSLLTLSYYGAEKVMPHYNVMGVAKAALEASVKYLAVDLGKYNVRVNALSAGPARTLASSGIGDFNYILKWNQYNSPLRRNVLLDEVGKSGLYLLSDLSSAVTGEIHHVDCGYNVVGMKSIDAPDISIV